MKSGVSKDSLAERKLLSVGLEAASYWMEEGEIDIELVELHSSLNLY